MPRKKNDSKPYCIVGAYDTETTNISSWYGVEAFPILHQLGTIAPHTDYASITSENVEQVVSLEMCRHADEIYTAFDRLITQGAVGKYVPVVMVHNLGFDMYALADYLMLYDTKVLAKSTTKPITITVLDDSGKPALVFWDTLGFYQKPLATMGAECRYKKLVGDWDYNLVRTPETPLTKREKAYAAHDIYVMWAYLGYWCRHNPDIKPDKLALNVVTKTGVVREKRKALLAAKKFGKYDVGSMWYFQNRTQAPKTDEELFFEQACTRGGLTFCASAWAGMPLCYAGTGLCIAGFDATSQHPAQMVTHKYPQDFHQATPKHLDMCAQIIQKTTLDWVLEHWYQPFGIAFNALFKFTGLRMKPGTIFQKNGIATLAWARTRKLKMQRNEDNEAGTDFLDMIHELGYMDTAIDETHAFGKLTSSGECAMFLTELEYWIMTRVYEWDTCEALDGYMTMRYTRPTDMTVLSVMRFYDAKNQFKQAMHDYEQGRPLSNYDAMVKLFPSVLVDAMHNGTADAHDVKMAYLGTKADLNALFGVEATNEYKPDMTITAAGITIEPPKGLEDAPKNPKAWYQLGQRVVGWSRIAQIVVMELAAPHIEGIVNGDTDSVKFIIREEKLADLQRALSRLSDALDISRAYITERVKRQYPSDYVELQGIGHYVLEFTAYDFCAAWNKAYVIRDSRGYHYTIAGIRTDYGEHSYNALASALERQGMDFADVCNLTLGYNLSIDPSITGFNARRLPEWGSTYEAQVTDYQGHTCGVCEPAALALYASPKEIGSTDMEDNAINAAIARKNNPNVNTRPYLLKWVGSEPELIDLLAEG